MSDYTLFVGIDIAAASATVAYARARDAIATPFTIQQTPEGFAALQARLTATGHAPAQTLVVMEATGTYWMRLAVALHAAGFGVSVINPRQAHHFAATRLRHAKTDPLDAVLLTELAILLQPAPWTPPVAQYEQLRQLLARRDDLVHMRTQERNRLHALRQCPVITPHVQADLEDHLAYLDRQLAALDTALADLLHHTPLWDTATRLLLSILGIGPITAGWLILVTRAFTLPHTADQLAAYAGLAPLPHQSGRSQPRRDRLSAACHTRLRTALYMATLSATQHNPAIQRFYDRLRARGKPAKVARCAAARKLVHIACAVVTKGVPFDKHYVSTA